ncbi:MAG: sugar nucleotide-binding protein [Patescibacteria group bacterium]|nr:sugar nucleotide-binding protein [Patescibacteria group bacterium]
MTILLTGGSGLVGHELVSRLSQYYFVVAPSRDECDIVNPYIVRECIKGIHPSIIIHAAAYVNAGEAEKERGDKNGVCYRTNVDGAQTVVAVGHKIGAFVIYISTGSVFHGTEENPGPFEITDRPEDNPDKNGWYGYTKYLGELTGPDAIIRISHPVVPHGVKDDYIQKMIHLYDQGNLFPLFTDQYFPLTFMADLVAAVSRIIERRQQGVFHVASPDMVTPYELFTTIRPDSVSRVTKISIEDFYKEGNSRLRFAKYSAISSEKTQELLGISFLSWKEGINDVYKIS